MKTFSALVRKITPILAAALVPLTSCVLSEEPLGPVTPPTPQDGTAEVAFMAEMPAPTAVATRGVGSAPENRVDDIYVLVFEPGTDGSLVYKGKGRNLAVAAGATNDNRVTFKATLPVGTAYDFMVLANAGASLAAINVSDTPAKKRSDVLALTRTLAAGAKWNAASAAMTPIPMWGELKNRTLAASDAVTFPLTRMLARVNVEYSPANTAAPANFRLSSVRVYNYSKSGAVVPAAANLDADGVTVGQTTAPDGGYAAETGGALVYEGDAVTAARSCTGMIYLFEAPHNGSTYKLPAGNADWIDNPCLVVGGRFSADGTNWPANDTYYRVDFIRKTGGATPAEEWLSLLRNFSYNVTITEVGGEGYRDPDTALRSAPFNMEANILPWNERGMEKVVFDGVFYLSVSRDEFVFQRRGQNAALADGSNTVKIKTDYLLNGDSADAGSGWRVDRIVKTGTEEPVTWLRLVPDKRPGGWRPDDVNDAHFAFEANTAGANREADVRIKAGRLEYKIHVVQKILSLDVMNVDETRIPDNTISFVIPDTGTAPGEHTGSFRVEWSYGSLPVGVTGRNNANGAFPPAWISGAGSPTFPDPLPYGSTDTPAVATIPGQGGNLGKVNYEVTPAAVTPAMLGKDPFYETNTTYCFRVTNNVGAAETLTDSIVLRQIHYDILADQQKYRLDGGVHTLTVRSNARWEIVDIEEHLFNSAQPTPPNPDGTPVMIDFTHTYDNFKRGLHFAPNVNGTALAFHVVDNESAAHDGKWGTVYVTLRMTTPEGETKTIRVAMPFPPASKLLLGMGYHDPAYATNVGIGTQYHKNSAHQMLSSPYNFGSMDESIYRVEGFRILGYHAAGKSAPTEPATYPDYTWHVNSLVNWLNKHNPDVLVMSSYPYAASAIRFNANEMRLINEYLINGGAVILCNIGPDGTSSAYLADLMESLAKLPRDPSNPNVPGPTVSYTNADGSTTADVTTYTGTGSYFRFEDVPNDPILNGPFGRLTPDMHWGSHYFHGGIKTSLVEQWAIPLSKMRDYSGNANGNDSYTNIFRHKNYNLVWIGNESFTGSNNPEFYGTYPTYCPFELDPLKYYAPKVREGYGMGSAKVGVYNSTFLANAVAWALTVTNHTPPPAPGYQNVP